LSRIGAPAWERPAAKRIIAARRGDGAHPQTTTTKGNPMTVQKIAALLGLVLALVAAFVTIPYVSLILAVLGLIVGWTIVRDDHVRVLVSALVLAALAGTFAEIPEAGLYVTAIITNVARIAAGAALMIVFRNIYARATA
jgi:hypothetical protein